MEQENKKYEFRAVTTVSQVILYMIIWIIIFSILKKVSEIIFHYDEIKSPSVFVNLKVLGIPMVISFYLLLLISQYVISKKYFICLNKNNITIYQNNKLRFEILTNELKSVKYSIINKNKPKNNKYITSLVFEYNKKKINLITGFFFTKKKESIILENFIENILHTYLIDHGFISKEKNNTNYTNYVLTKNN